MCFCMNNKKKDVSDLSTMTNAFHRKNFYKRFSTEIVKYIFVQSNENRYLRNKSSFRRPPIKTVYHGSESVSYLGPKI